MGFFDTLSKVLDAILAVKCLIEDMSDITDATKQEFIDMTWKEFEDSVTDAIEAALDTSKWQVAEQHQGRLEIRADIHVAERRQGGVRIVIDAKRYVNSPLNKRAIDTTYNYKVQKRASKAILVASPVTIIPDSVRNHATIMEVEIIQAKSFECVGRKVKNICEELLTSES